jgi:urease accessory protein
MNALLLLLLDSRAPAGAHHHSGGMEAAVGTGLVTGLAGLEDFCQARLRTSARVSAAFAAAAARVRSEQARQQRACELGAGEERARQQWAELDAELEARMPSEAMRTASRQLGGALIRLLRSVLPEADLVTPWTLGARPAPHHPLVLGTGVALAGGSPELAARAAALAACAGPASAAVRLLALDPMRATGVLARLAGEIDQVADDGAGYAGRPLDELPCPSAPALDLLAETHIRAEVRLFES